MDGLTFRDATQSDLPFIIGLAVGNSVVPTEDQPDNPHHPAYLAAFEAISADPNQRLVVAELAGERVGTVQITFIPGLLRLGMWRGLLESVHIVSHLRSQGLGARMVRWALEECRERGCGMVQLTSNKLRLDAHRFYERLGFKKSHEGFKYYF